MDFGTCAVSFDLLCSVGPSLSMEPLDTLEYILASLLKFCAYRNVLVDFFIRTPMNLHKKFIDE